MKTRTTDQQFPCGRGCPTASSIARAISDPAILRELIELTERASITYLETAVSLAEKHGAGDAAERLADSDQQSARHLLEIAERVERGIRRDATRAKLLAMKAAMAR